MSRWSADPELVETFRAEVEERLASLEAGLLALEGHARPRTAVAALFRDAHTVKGSARMLGLEPVVALAHCCEDLLGAVRDGRIGIDRLHVDLLLAGVEGVRRSLPGAARSLADDEREGILATLADAVAGRPFAVPRLLISPAVVDDPGPEAGPATVRVPAQRVHDVLDLVGEAELEVRRITREGGRVRTLAAEQARLAGELHAEVAALPAGVVGLVQELVQLGDRLGGVAAELATRAEEARDRLAGVRAGAMGLAMVPLRQVTQRFAALVRDVAGRAGASVDLVVVGEDVELDARVLDAVAESLCHLVVNAVDHGTQAPAERRAVGKPAAATVTVTARAAGAQVVVAVADDGEGIDEDRLREAAVAHGVLDPASRPTGSALWRLIFTPGLSTRAEVTQTSGRGVGLDAVRSSVEDLGGTVEVESRRGAGTTLTLTLPVSLGVLRCLIARIGSNRYAIPLAAAEETVALAGVERHEVAGVPCLVRDGRTVPLVELAAVLGEPVSVASGGGRRCAVVVRSGDGAALAFAVDRLEDELEIVVKQLGPFLGRPACISGASVDTDGRVVLVLDVREVAAAHVAGRRLASAPATGAPTVDPPAGGPARVLVVEDSPGVRELERVILEGAGYRVTTAADGLEGARHLRAAPVDLVVSDVEMPGIDGFTLTRQLRRTPGWEHVPVVIMTSRGDDADRRAGLDAGASAYLLKSEFDQEQLVGTVRRLVGR